MATLLLLLLGICVQLSTAHIEGYVSSSGSNELQQKGRNDIETARTKYKVNKILPTPDRMFLSDAKKEIKPDLKKRDNEQKGEDNEGLGIEIGKLPKTELNTAVTNEPDNGNDITTTTTVSTIEAQNETVATNATSDQSQTTTPNTRRLENQQHTEPSVLPPLHPRFRRIYNPDELATVDEFPFVAALLMNRELWCGAAIIDTDKVITAAHCLQLQYNNRFFREYVRMLTVRVGSTNATAGGEVYRVSEIIFHPNYKPESLEFNLVILCLHRNITFGVSDPVVEKIDFSRALTIPNDNKVLFLGWGSVLHPDGTGGQTLLQKVELPIYDIADCQDVYGRDLVTRNNFCAGYITVAKNVCNHDAGGPAIMNGELVGILSFSAARCDKPDYPAVFTQLGSMADWIDKYVGEKSSQSKPHKLRQH